MKTTYFLLTLILSFNFLKLFSQDVLLQEFKSDYFAFSYPLKWKLDSSDHKYSFYYNPALGDITISFYENKAGSVKELENIVLAANEKKEPRPDIKTDTLNGIITCIYKYDFNKVKYYIKAIQDQKKIYLISLNWNENSWETFKDVLLSSFNSFKPK